MVLNLLLGRVFTVILFVSMLTGDTVWNSGSFCYVSEDILHWRCWFIASILHNVRQKNKKVSGNAAAWSLLMTDGPCSWRKVACSGGVTCKNSLLLPSNVNPGIKFKRPYLTPDAKPVTDIIFAASTGQQIHMCWGCMSLGRRSEVKAESRLLSTFPTWCPGTMNPKTFTI